MKYIILGLALISCSSNTGRPRLMPLGDSITYGVGWDGGITPDAQGYRGYLSAMFPHYDFVGSQANGDFSQNHHEGHPGYPIVGQMYDGGWRPGILENVQSWIDASTPDIILLHIGTNDVAIQPTNPVVYQTMLVNLGLLLDKIHSINPLIHVYVAEIIEIDLDVPSPDQDNVYLQIQLYNQGIPGVVSSRPWATVVAMPTIPNEDMWDSAHPNPAGYKLMADAWASAMGG